MIGGGGVRAFGFDFDRGGLEGTAVFLGYGLCRHRTCDSHRIDAHARATKTYTATDRVADRPEALPS